MLGEHMEPQPEVIRAILLENSPCFWSRAERCATAEMTGRWIRQG